MVYVDNVTSRVEYLFKFLLTSILGIDISFTSEIETFIDHRTQKISYTRYHLRSGLFFEAHSSLLFERGIRDNMDLHIEFVDGIPYFFKTSAACTMGFDIFAASFYLMSRYEEYLPYVPDGHHRFPARVSLAYKKGFIRKPIIDIWAMRLLEVLKKHFPDLNPPQRSFKFINLFSVSKVWTYRGMGVLRNIAGSLEDLLCSDFKALSQRAATIFGKCRDPFDTYDDIINYHKKYKLCTILFFLVGRYDMYDRNVSIYHPDFRRLIKYMADDVKVGWYSSYASTYNPHLLVEEKKCMEGILYYPVTRSLQYFVKLHLPDTYRNLIELDIEEDYSMGFPDHIGFRAGTCTPFLFYDLKNDALTPLKLFPFSASISALKHYMKLSKKEIQQELLNLMREVKAVQGTYIFIMNNKVLSQDLAEEGWRAIYETLLDNL